MLFGGDGGRGPRVVRLRWGRQELAVVSLGLAVDADGMAHLLLRGSTEEIAAADDFLYARQIPPDGLDQDCDEVPE